MAASVDGSDATDLEIDEEKNGQSSPKKEKASLETEEGGDTALAKESGLITSKEDDKISDNSDSVRAGGDSQDSTPSDETNLQESPTGEEPKEKCDTKNLTAAIGAREDESNSNTNKDQDTCEIGESGVDKTVHEICDEDSKYDTASTEVRDTAVLPCSESVAKTEAEGLSEPDQIKASANSESCDPEKQTAKEETDKASDEHDDVFLDDCSSANTKFPADKQAEEKRSVEKSVSLSSEGKPEDGAKEERPVREMLVRRKRSESTNSNSSDKPVLETLTFGAAKIDEAKREEEGKAEGGANVLACLLCDRWYPADNKEDVLAHLVLMHKFVIADVNYIANLSAYLKYWKKRLEGKPLSDFCSKIVTNTGTKDEAPKEEFYLLCDALPEDKSLREHLQRKKLESVLIQQQKEREETKFCRQCLFCKQTYCGNRAVLFDHLLRDHTFHMGQPDNLVFTDELFDLIQSKLDNQLCLFCEKSFKDKASLREHMRKKQHRKINPKNKEYDRFYIINYMEMGKNWESLQSEDNRLVKTSDKGSDEEEEWGGWDEESEPKVVCLFCDSSCVVQAELQNHMKEQHNFDLQEVNHKLQLNFYQKVKLINYIRRQVYHKTCYGCQASFGDKETLLSHLGEFPDHIKKVPDSAVWDQPQYFFPTYEDDSLLCHLDDDDDGAAGDAVGVTVIAEDFPDVPDTILKDQKLRRDLLKA